MGFMGNKNFGGTPSGMNMNNFMKQAKKMQEDLVKAQGELKQKDIVVTSGGGVVKIVMDGQKHIKSIEISPEVVNPEEIEMLEDLVMSAVNEGIKQADEAAAALMGKLAGGLNGMF